MIPKYLKQFEVPVEDLHEWEHNPRKGDVEAVKSSLQRFGQRVPIIYRTEKVGSKKFKVVYAGNHRLRAAEALGWKSVAAVDADDLSKEQVKAFAVADNRTADLASYDDELLADLIRDLNQFDKDLFDDLKFNDDDMLADLDDDLPDLDASPQIGDMMYKVVIECDSEKHQQDLLAELDDRGLKVKAAMV